ncbi:hypothetical protein [Microbacterium pumilum]|uniref:Uncharacterized protein n=1 Tax=Microbacterium pumilum TaxID=344165 RepID=A0ABN2T3B3_9MICO
MTTSKKTQPTAPLAHRVPAEVSDLIATYAAWIEEQTGYKADPMSVYLGSQLRSTFQKGESNQARLAQAAKDRAAKAAAKAKARAEREAAAASRAAQKAAEEKAKAQDAADKVAPVKVSPKAQAKINAVMPKPASKPARRRPANAAVAPVATETVEAV